MNTTTNRSALETLLRAVVTRSPQLGYAFADIRFGNTIEVRLAKEGSSFVLWLTPKSDPTACFRRTDRFKVGHNGEPTDRLGYTLLADVCEALHGWERTLPLNAEQALFEAASVGAFPSAPNSGAYLEPKALTALQQASFAPLYDDWLEDRDRVLRERLHGLRIGQDRNILLLNATKGLLFYPSLVDFFVLLQRTQPGVRVTAASYFSGIFQFQEEVARKGLRVVSIPELEGWGVAELNRFDAVLMIGPSDLTARWMSLDGLRARLLLLDLGFYHQLIEAHATRFYQDTDMLADTTRQVNRLTAYSCQPLAKVEHDFARVCATPLIDWRWFDYIPIGFRYCRYYSASAPAFDVALLGRAGRDYSLLLPEQLRGKRFLFIGSPDNAPDIDYLRRELDVTVASGLDSDTYAKLLALCRCVLLPVPTDVRNVFLSVVDAIASGRPLITSRHVGLSRLAGQALPAIFVDPTPTDFSAQAANFLDEPGRETTLAASSIAFAKDSLDVYRILQTILEDGLL